MSERRGLWLLLGWLLTAGIAAGLYLRWSIPSSSLMIALVSLAPLLVVPLVLVVVSAWRAWSRPLGLAAVALIIAYVATFVSVDAVVGCGPETAEDAIVVFTHNVWLHGGEPAAVAGSIAASDADVVVLQEVWPAFMAELDGDPSLSGYRYRTAEPAEDTTGLAVWSRFPVADATIDRLGGVPMLRSRIDSPYGSFGLDAIHLTAPVAGENVASWQAQLDGLAGYDATGPGIMAGDFNATMDHSQFRHLLDQGWTDVHEPKGCGYDATWPTGRRTPTLLRLDHVLVTDHFEVLAVEIGSSDGSDHRSVTATLRLRNSAAAPN
ncbi:MAG: endonuclease/exonuclease/phosphatase family protein [Acidimicrobiia bacterium]|nr:endonuclease/exonuclease/phosphatase family protein [Acidimicrobiia bacterium]